MAHHRRLAIGAMVVSVAAVATLTGCGSGSGTTEPARSTAATAATSTTGGGAVSPPAGAPVDRLEVRDAGTEATLPPYRRDAFGEGWDYDPASGCNTRERVLIEESLVPATVDDRCHPSAGRWRSAYDGVVTDDPADLQIDHLVALADAWRSGAAAWTDDERRAFANDVDHPESLVAVTGSSNQSKSDASPDRWLPPEPDARCRYAADWVAVKARWHLSVTGAEKATLVQVLSGC